MTGEGEENRELFELLKNFLKNLALQQDEEKQKLLFLAFEFKSIDLLGFFPQKQIKEGEFLNLILQLKDQPLESISKLQVDAELLNRLELIATEVLQAICEREFKSRKFLILLEKQKFEENL